MYLYNQALNPKHHLLPEIKKRESNVTSSRQSRRNSEKQWRCNREHSHPVYDLGQPIWTDIFRRFGVCGSESVKPTVQKILFAKLHSFFTAYHSELYYTHFLCSLVLPTKPREHRYMLATEAHILLAEMFTVIALQQPKVGQGWHHKVRP